MESEQAEAALALAACSEEDGAVRCPLWRQVQEEARSMVSGGCFNTSLGRRVVLRAKDMPCDACHFSIHMYAGGPRASHDSVDYICSHEGCTSATAVHVCQGHLCFYISSTLVAGATTRFRSCMSIKEAEGGNMQERSSAPACVAKHYQ